MNYKYNSGFGTAFYVLILLVIIPVLLTGIQYSSNYRSNHLLINNLSTKAKYSLETTTDATRYFYNLLIGYGISTQASCNYFNNKMLSNGSTKRTLIDTVNFNTADQTCELSFESLATVDGDFSSNHAVSYKRNAILQDNQHTYCKVMAVGANGESLCLNNGAWTSLATPTSRDLNSVYCNAYDNCWSVGNRSGGELILHWNSAEWIREPVSSNISNNSLNSVACPNSNRCNAVGSRINNNNEFTVTYNGSRWTQLGPSGMGNSPDLYDITCPNNNLCLATGRARRGTELIAVWNGSQWQRLSAISVIPNVSLNGAYCSDGFNFCMLVGRRSSGSPVTVKWDGSWQNVSPSSTVSRSNLNDIDCINENYCWAVGQSQNGPTLLHWNGSDWSRYSPTGLPNENLNDIYLVNENEGFAVGNNGTILSWNGKMWYPMKSNSTDSLFSVHGYE